MSKAPWEEVCFASALNYALGVLPNHVPSEDSLWRRFRGDEALAPRWKPNIAGWGLRMAMSTKTLPHPPFHQGPRIIGESHQTLMLLAVTKHNSPYPELEARYRVTRCREESPKPPKGTPAKNVPEPEELYPSRVTSLVLGVPYTWGRGGSCVGRSRRPREGSYLLHNHDNAYYRGSEHLTPLFTLPKDLTYPREPQSMPRNGRGLLHLLRDLVNVASALYLRGYGRPRTYLSDGLPPEVVASVEYERAEAMRALNVYGSPLARQWGAHLTAPGVHWAPAAVVQQPVPAPMPPAEEAAAEEEAASGE